MGGTPRLDDGGPADKGYSDCAWMRPGGEAVLSVLHWEDPDGAGRRYDDMVNALKRRRHQAARVKDLGEDGMIFDESGGGLMAFTIAARSGPHVLQVIARGVTRSSTVEAARTMVARLPADLRPSGDELPPEGIDAAPAEPSEPTESSEAPPDQPETAAETPPAAPEAPPAEAAPPEPPPAEAAPPPPAEPAPTPPKASAGPIKGSPACALLKAGDLTQAGAGTGFAVVDGGPERAGESNCTWQSSGSNISISANLLRGRAIREVAEDAASYFEIMQEGAPGAEVLSGVGDAAYLESTGTDESPAYSVSILSGNAVILLNALRVDHDTAVVLARKAAGNVPARP